MGRLSQSETSVSIKCDRYSIVRQVLLIGTIITKWDKCYYKVRQVFHSAIGITKWDDYYKVRQVLL